MINFNDITEMMNGLGGNGAMNIFSQKTGATSGGDRLAKVAAMAVPLILQAVSKKMETTEGKDSVLQTLDRQSGRNVGHQSVEDMLSQADEEEGNQILEQAFPDKGRVISEVARKTGTSEAEAGKVMRSVAPVLLQALANKKEAQQLDPQGLAEETQKWSRQAQQKSGNAFDLTDLFRLGSQDSSKETNPVNDILKKLF